MLCIINLCFKVLCVLYLCLTLCWAPVLSDIFKTLTVKLTSGFRPWPHFLENKIFAENIWLANLLFSSFVSYLCSYLIFVILYTPSYFDGWNFNTNKLAKALKMPSWVIFAANKSGHNYISWIYQAVGNIIKKFEEIQSTIFEKYSKRRSDLDFCDGEQERRAGGIMYSSSWTHYTKHQAVDCAKKKFNLCLAELGAL